MSSKTASDSLMGKTLRGFMWTAGGYGSQYIIRIGVMALLTRALSPADFGLFSAALFVIGLTELFSQVGIGPALVQLKEIEKRHVQTAVSLSVGLSIVLCALAILSSYLFAPFFRMPKLALVIQVLSIAFPLRALCLVPEAILQRQFEFRKLSLVEFATYAVGYGACGLVMAKLGFGVWALVGAFLLSAVCRLLMFVLLAPSGYSCAMDRSAAKQLLGYGGGFTVARVFNYFALQGDNLVVGRWLGQAALGLYSRAYLFMSIPSTVFGQVVDRVLFPALAELQSDKRQLATAYLRSLSIVATLVLPTTGALWVLAPELISVLLGNKWMPAVLPFQVLAFGMYFRVGYKLSDILSRATGTLYALARNQILYAVLVIGGAALAASFGLAGVAAAVVLALAAYFFISARLSLTTLGLSWRAFFTIHAAGLRLGVGVLLLTWLAANTTRRIGLSPAGVIAAAALLNACVLLILAYFFPRHVCGNDLIYLARRFERHLPLPWLRRMETRFV